MAGGGPSAVRDFGNFFRHNTRYFDFYTGNDALILSTAANPLHYGASYYNLYYNGLIDAPFADREPASGPEFEVYDYLNVALFGTSSGIFANELIDWTPSYDANDVVYSSSARIALIKIASWTKGPGRSGP
ncbi:MAG: hypothetical protein JO225_00130 [Candidatus Eremiobacteraeota bacterium]|nr:hypothetical protein [Candidatus Eremiobacteraeota bacterium]